MFCFVVSNSPPKGSMGSFRQQFSGRGVTFLKKVGGVTCLYENQTHSQIMLQVLSPTEQGLGFL